MKRLGAVSAAMIDKAIPLGKKVYIVKQDAFSPALDITWALYRVGEGPFRCEGQGFKKVSEAREFARKYGYQIVTLRAVGS
jgi:hypothetical protein